MIYTTNGLLLAWVILDNGKYWIVPASPTGWTRRTQYRGHIRSLSQVGEYNKIGLGMP